MSENAGDTRSAYDIVWSCLATIVTCTWVAVHPNVPSPRDSSARILRRRMMLMLIALLAPEYIATWAARQWVSAGAIVRNVEKTHKRKWNRTHGFFIAMGGLMLVDRSTRHPIGPVDVQLLHEGALPDLNEEEIKDKSKSDGLAKTLVLLQTTWFVLHVLARANQRLHIAEIEIVTLAFVALNFATYGFWWHKPLNVRCPVLVEEQESLADMTFERTSLVLEEDAASVVIDAEKGPTKNDVQNRDEDPIGSIIKGTDFILPGITFPAHSSSPDDGVLEWSRGHLRFPTFYPGPQRHVLYSVAGQLGRLYLLRRFLLPGLLQIALATVFASIHFVPLLVYFAREEEKKVWLACSVVMLVVPIVGLLEIVLLTFKRGGRSLRYLNFFLTGCYATARLIMLALMFVLLKNMPESAYQTVEWTKYIPHI